MRLILALAMTLLVAHTARSQANTAPAAGSESLGGQLLDDLPGAQQDPLPPSHEVADDGADTTGQSGIGEKIDPELRFFPLRFDDVGGAGESAEQQPSGPLRLARAGEGMVRAESLLAQQDTLAGARNAQAQVVEQLDALIAELSKQCNCQGGGGNKPPSASQRSAAKPGKLGGKPGSGSGAARDSNARVNSGKSEAVDKGELDEMVKRLWGHLPPRQREQMLQSFSNEFLPKYELQIEQYYQGLSEQGSGDGMPQQRP